MVGGFTAVVIWWLLCGDSCKPAASRLMLMAICCKASGTWMSQRVLPGHHAQLPITPVTTLPVRVLHVAVEKVYTVGCHINRHCVWEQPRAFLCLRSVLLCFSGWDGVWGQQSWQCMHPHVMHHSGCLLVMRCHFSIACLLLRAGTPS